MAKSGRTPRPRYEDMFPDGIEDEPQPDADGNMPAGSKVEEGDFTPEDFAAADRAWVNIAARRASGEPYDDEGDFYDPAELDDEDDEDDDTPDGPDAAG